VAQLKRYLDSLSLRAAVLIGAVGSLATIWPVFLIGGNIGLAIDTAQQVCLGAIGVLVLIRASRQSRVVLPERRFVAKWIAVAIALGAS